MQHSKSDEKIGGIIMERRHYLITGEVQGLGFRSNIRNTALSLNITGWVKNLPDGSVEMEAEGREKDLSALESLIKNPKWAYIEEMNISEVPAVGDGGFRIK